MLLLTRVSRRLAPAAHCGRRPAAHRRHLSGQALGDRFFEPDGRALLPDVEAAEYFHLFGLSPGVSLPPKVLDDGLRTLQKRLHPDLFAREAEEQKQRAEQASSLVNQAYGVLKDPLLRAEYALKLKGFKTLDEESNVVDPALLMEQFEAREAIEECESPCDLEATLDHNGSQMADAEATIVSSYESGDFEGAVQAVVRLKYVCKLREEIMAKSAQEDWPVHLPK